MKPTENFRSMWPLRLWGGESPQVQAIAERVFVGRTMATTSLLAAGSVLALGAFSLAGHDSCETMMPFAASAALMGPIAWFIFSVAPRWRLPDAGSDKAADLRVRGLMRKIVLIETVLVLSANFLRSLDSSSASGCAEGTIIFGIGILASIGAYALLTVRRPTGAHLKS